MTKKTDEQVRIRIALGAQIGDVRQMFLHHGLWLTAAGITLGIAVALALTRVMSTLLFGVGRMDPMTYAPCQGSWQPWRWRRIFQRAAPRASIPLHCRLASGRLAVP